jgi:hypothetical protein
MNEFSISQYNSYHDSFMFTNIPVLPGRVRLWRQVGPHQSVYFDSLLDLRLDYENNDPDLMLYSHSVNRIERSQSANDFIQRLEEESIRLDRNQSFSEFYTSEGSMGGRDNMRYDLIRSVMQRHNPYKKFRITQSLGSGSSGGIEFSFHLSSSEVQFTPAPPTSRSLDSWNEVEPTSSAGSQTSPPFLSEFYNSFIQLKDLILKQGLPLILLAIIVRRLRNRRR